VTLALTRRQKGRRDPALWPRNYVIPMVQAGFIKNVAKRLAIPRWMPSCPASIVKLL
jgi:hypothetical protein